MKTIESKDLNGKGIVTKEIITSVHDYFRAKLVKGEFETDRQNEFHVDAIIDNEYRFTIWWANEEYGIKTYEGSFMKLNLKVKDKKSIWSKLRKIKKELVDKEVEQNEREILDRLKKKYASKE